MPNSNERGGFSQGKYSTRKYYKELENKLKVPLTAQMREVADVVVVLANNLFQDFEKNEGNILALDNLLRTPPEDLSLIEDKDELFSMANFALAYLIRKDRQDNLSQRLLDATGPNANANTAIGLNDTFVEGYALSRALRGLRSACSFEGKGSIYLPVGQMDKEKSDGSQKFLNALTLSGQPLIPYQRNVIERVIDLVPTIDNRSVKGLLPTKVKGITVQYVYSKSQNTPIMSIEIIRIP